ncbi:MAG: TonB-dependent receptor [Sphingomicrobium sp.]
MRNSTMIRALFTTTLLGAPDIGEAQTAPPSKQIGNPAPAQNANMVVPEASQNEIIITAQKRSERLQNVPIQVDVLTGQALEARQIKMTNEIVRTVPNLTIEKTDTYSNSVIVLRGIAQASNADAPVAVVVDGVPQDDPKQFNMHLFDVAEIEVLKGPQGSLYGRDAEAGAVIINTVQPTNDFRGFADVSFGRGSTVETTAALSGPIVADKVLFRIAGSYFHTNGVIPNTFRHVNNDSVPHDWSVRANLLFHPGGSSTFSLIGQHEDYNAGHVYFVPVWSGNPNDFELPQSNFPNRGHGSTTNLTGKFDNDFGFATLTAIGGYTKLKQVQITDVDFTNPVDRLLHPNSLPFQAGDNQPFSNRIYSQEIRLAAPTASRFRWLISEDYLNARQFINTHLFLDTGHPDTDPDNPALILRQNPATYTRSNWGVSGQVDYDVTHALTLTAGLRYDTDRRKQINKLNGQVRTAKFDATQPRLSAAYKFTKDKLVYATWGVGFRSGGFNPPSFRVPIYRDEKLTNYEIGFKTQWLDHRLTINGALFHSIVKNLQFSAIDFNSGSQVTSNIDRARINGAELEAVATPLQGLDLFIRMGLSDPKITKFAANPAVAGNVLPRGYKASFNTGFDYEGRIAPGTSFFAHADLQHYTKKYWFVDNLDVQRPKSYVNGSLGVKYGNFSASVWGKNIFGVRSYETYFPGQQTGLPFDVGFPNKPATYGVELIARM